MNKNYKNQSLSKTMTAAFRQGYNSVDRDSVCDNSTEQDVQVTDNVDESFQYKKPLVTVLQGKLSDILDTSPFIKVHQQFSFTLTLGFLWTI